MSRPTSYEEKKGIAAIKQLQFNRIPTEDVSALNALYEILPHFSAIILNGSDDELISFLEKLGGIKISKERVAAGCDQADIGIMGQSIVEIFRQIDLVDTSRLPQLVMDNFWERKFALKIDIATNHGRITNQLKKSGVDVDSTQSFGTDDIIKIKEFFQKNGKEILELFTTVKITPEALRDHIKKHLTDAFAAFQEIKGDSIPSEDVRGLIETLANVGEVAKAAVGLGNDFSTKENKEKLLKKIKEKLPDTSDDILVTAAAAAFNTTEQVVRFERAQKAETEKIIATRKALTTPPTVPSSEGKKDSAQDTRVRRLTRAGGRVTSDTVAYSAAADEAVAKAELRDDVGIHSGKSAEGSTANLDAQKKRERFEKEVKTFITEGNLIAAIKILKETRDAQTQQGIKIEAFEENYLKFVMAALDIAGIEGKPELKSALLEQVSMFRQRFSDKAKANGLIDEHGIVSNKVIGQGMAEVLHDFCDDEIKKNLIKPLEKAGIVNVSEKLITARGFQDLAIHHPDMTKKLEVKKITTLNQIFKEKGQQPVSFEKLPWWHQDLMQKYAPAILAGQSPLPTSVKHVLRMSVTKEEKELDQIKPPHPLLVTIASSQLLQKVFSGFKAFSRFTDEIMERCGKRAAPENIGREERVEEFSDSYDAARKEIIPPKDTDVAAVSAEHVAADIVAGSASVADPSQSNERAVEVISDAPQVTTRHENVVMDVDAADKEEAREIRMRQYELCGFSEDEITKLEEVFEPSVSAPQTEGVEPPAIADELDRDLGKTKVALEAARDGILTPIAATTQLGETDPELGRSHSPERSTTPNTPLPTAPSPVGEIAEARKEAGKVFLGLPVTTKSELDDDVSDDEMARSAFAAGHVARVLRQKAESKAAADRTRS